MVIFFTGKRASSAMVGKPKRNTTELTASHDRGLGYSFQGSGANLHVRSKTVKYRMIKQVTDNEVQLVSNMEAQEAYFAGGDSVLRVA
jgi:hypothetical protein